MAKRGVIGGKSGQLVWEVCRALVFAATNGWCRGESVNRRLVAVVLGTTEGTLNRMMSPGDELGFRADHLHALMTAEDLVPAEARELAAARLCREWGFVVSPAFAGAPDAVAATSAALGLAAAAGETADLVRRAAADGRVDDAEARQISAAAMHTQLQAGEVLNSVGGAVSAGAGGERSLT